MSDGLKTEEPNCNSDVPDKENGPSTPISHSDTPKSGRTTPNSHRTPPSSRPTTPNSQRTAPSSRPTTPNSQRTAPISRPTTPNSHRTLPSSRPTTPSSRRSAVNSRPSTPSSRSSARRSRQSTPKTSSTTTPMSSPRRTRDPNSPRPMNGPVWASPKRQVANDPSVYLHWRSPSGLTYVQDFSGRSTRQAREVYTAPPFRAFLKDT